MHEDSQTQAQEQPVQFFAVVGQEGRTSEAQQVTRLVQQTLLSHPDDSIAILVRNRSHLRDIIPALQQAKINWSAIDIDPLAQRPLISDLMALTLALINPADRVAWLAILRAPWCGLSLADLHQLTHLHFHLQTHLYSTDENQHTSQIVWQQLASQERINSLSDSGIKATNRLLNKLKPAIKSRYRKPLR